MNIALCSLAYNSAKYIPESIGNILPFVDEVNILIDSRTTDKSRELLDNMGANYKDYAWQHNFSDAKNECIRMVSKDIDWIIYLDDDEKLTKKDAKEFTQRIRDIKDDKIGGILLPRKHHYPNWTYDEDNYIKELYPDYHQIAFRNLKDKLYCRFRVHEDFFRTSINAAGLKIITMDDINRHHHAWKGSKEKYEANKHKYFEALSKLKDEWTVGDPIPKEAEDINKWDNFKG
jgi:hypothetical protein